MKLPIYVLVPTEKQHRQALKRLRPFMLRCVADVSANGLARAKPVSCFAAGALKRHQAARLAFDRMREGKRRETLGRDLLQRVSSLCEITNALAAAASAAEALLCAGEADDGRLVVDEAEAAKVRAAIAWAQELARVRQGEMEKGS